MNNQDIDYAISILEGKRRAIARESFKTKSGRLHYWKIFEWIAALKCGITTPQEVIYERLKLD